MYPFAGIQIPIRSNSYTFIHEGTAFAAAGITYRNGTAVVALDAQTGDLKWQNLTCGEDRKVSASGTLLARGPQILLAGGRSASVTAFDSATGKIDRIYPSGVRGYEIGSLDENTVLFGGRPMFTPQVVSQASGKSDSIRLINLNEGKATPLGRRNSLFPAWDNEVFIYTQNGLTGLTARSRRKSEGEESAAILWGPIAGSFLSVAVAKNVVVATSHRMENRKEVYTLAVCAKSDGKAIWQQKLDNKPKLDGLAIDREGNIVIAFDDGTLEMFSE